MQTHIQNTHLLHPMFTNIEYNKQISIDAKQYIRSHGICGIYFSHFFEQKNINHMIADIYKSHDVLHISGYTCTDSMYLKKEPQRKIEILISF